MKTNFRAHKFTASAIALIFLVLFAIPFILRETDSPSALPTGPFNGIDAVQHFPASPDNKLANETARLKAARKLKVVQTAESTDEQ